MSSDPAPAPDIDASESTKWTPLAMAAAALLVLLFGVITVAGVRGCLFADPTEAAKTDEDKNKKAEKQKMPEFEIGLPAVQPADPDSPLHYAKPGHWASATQRMRANYRDLIGQSRTEMVSQQGRPFPIDRTPFVLRSERPVALSKGQPKNIESTFFIPLVNESIRLSTDMMERGLGVTVPTVTPLSKMPSYQYQFVVLAKEPTRYTYIKTLDCVRVPFSGLTDMDAREDVLHYRVVQLDASQAVSLSDNPLTWTSIAYVLWDEVDPQVFTPEQEKALVDWIHWGGQLIISGPDSLDSLKGSFLEPYLPARSGGPRSIAADDLAEWNVEGDPESWMISTERVPGKPLRPTVPWSGVKLEFDRDDATIQPLRNTGELLVEGQVGRGRVVVSAMQLSERDLINWRSGFDSLFNACILRRPPRIYREGAYGGPTVLWANPELEARRLDARLTTRQRYFTRDLGVETSFRWEDVEDEFNQFQNVNQFGQPEKIREYRPPAGAGGIGAWNDFNATANAARGALREAAGVEVPDSTFVVVCLAAYLAVLVPLNWLVFHTLGRVEWAWIAAPIIAIAGTFVVVHRARLDIGFVRAQTEIGVLEQQPDHPRAHFSRYTALYTSLSTTYDLEFPNLTTLAAPFPSDAADRMLVGQGYDPIAFQRYDQVRLTGLPVSSASTRLVHSEQMFALNGPIELGKSTAQGREQIVNHSQFALRSVALVRRPDRNVSLPADVQLEGQWIGELLPGKSQAVAWPARFREGEVPFERERGEEAGVQSSERLNLEPIFRLALDPATMEVGEWRLVARIDEILPGEAITPAASQIRGANLVVAHLRYAPLEPPERDHNTRQDIKAAANDDLDFDAPAVEDETGFN